MNIEDIKKHMKKNHITYEELSNKSNIPKGSLSHIFRGKVKNPRLDTMNAICNALGLQYDVPLQPTIIDENNLAHYRTSRKNMIILYDNSGDEYRFEYDKNEFQRIYDICDTITKKY